MRTGVIQPLPGIGDMMWLLPALRAVAANAPDTKITLFTKASALPELVLAAEPWIEKIVMLPRKRGLFSGAGNLFYTWHALIRNRPDRLYILHQSSRYRLAAKLAGIREIIAYPKDLAKSKDNGWIKSIAFLKRLDMPVADIHSRLSVKPEAKAAAQKRFQHHPQPWFVIGAGASEQSRCWPAENFAACADALLDMQGGTVFLIGAGREAARIEEVRKASRDASRVVPVIGIGFDEVMGLIASSTGILGNDSGPVNIAAALGKPAYVLCGVSKPGLHSENLHLIEPDLPVGQAEGMARISPAHVIDFIRKKSGR